MPRSSLRDDKAAGAGVRPGHQREGLGGQVCMDYAPLHEPPPKRSDCNSQRKWQSQVILAQAFLHGCSQGTSRDFHYLKA